MGSVGAGFHSMCGSRGRVSYVCVVVVGRVSCVCVVVGAGFHVYVW